MDNQQPQTTKPISDDQELAEALAGVSKEAENLNFEETPASTAADEDSTEQETDAPQVQMPPVAEYTPPTPNTTINSESGDLDSIKKDALTELRPLVDKLDLAPEEKFDIYLLILRNTDDKTLIAPAHAAAQNIADETKRAEALLEVIKEIDYLSNPQQAV